MNVQTRDRNSRVHARDVMSCGKNLEERLKSDLHPATVGSHLAAFCITRDINVGIACALADMTAGFLDFQRVHYRGRTVKAASNCASDE